MNIIEQMYKEYGVKLIDPCNGCDKKLWEDCQKCATPDEFYPPFTAEKQIELIKLMFECFCFKYNVIPQKTKNNKWQYGEEIYNTWEEALAAWVYNCEPILDNSKVKEILEG